MPNTNAADFANIPPRPTELGEVCRPMPTPEQGDRCSDPQVELHLHELNTSQQLECLRQHQLDAGILYLPIESSALKVVSILKERLVVAMPESHPLAVSSQLSIRALSREPFIIRPHRLGGGLYSKIMQFFQQSGFNPTVVQEAMQLQTMISLVAGEVGVALVPASLQNLQRAGVVYRCLQELTPEVEIAIAWRQHDDGSPVLQKFVNAVRELV